jgi:ribosomal protein L32
MIVGSRKYSSQIVSGTRSLEEGGERVYSLITSSVREKGSSSVNVEEPHAKLQEAYNQNQRRLISTGGRRDQASAPCNSYDMALRNLRPLLLQDALLPLFFTTVRYSTTVSFRPLSRHSLPSLSLAFPLSVPAIIHLNVPSILAGIWESILRAVPKKKTSHMKKRHRFMAGKALKDVTNLNRCSACGNVKRAHLLCPYCVQGGKLSKATGFGYCRADLEPTDIKDMWLGKKTGAEETTSKAEA